MSEKIYCGSGIGKFEGSLVEISLCLSDLPKDKIFEYNGKKYIKLKVVKKREVDQYGKTHYVEVDMWKPEPKKQAPTESATPLPDAFKEEPTEENQNNLPF